MKKSALVIVLAWAVSVNVLVAQGQRTRTETYDPAKHHQDVTLRVTADAPATFTLPTSNSPIRLLPPAKRGGASVRLPRPLATDPFQQADTPTLYLPIAPSTDAHFWLP